MPTEATKDGFITGPQAELNKLSVAESPRSGTVVTSTVPVTNVQVTVRGQQSWIGAPVSGSSFRFDGSTPSNATFTPQNSLNLELNSSKNKFVASAGEDSIAFGKKTTKDQVNLGKKDGSADLVDLASLKKVKDLKIRNFGQEDTLKIGKKSYDYDKLQDKSFKNITIKFD